VNEFASILSITGPIYLIIAGGFLSVRTAVARGAGAHRLYPVLAQKYHHEGFCAAALLVTTVLSFVSISALLWAMHAMS
jgi:malonate transporter